MGLLDRLFGRSEKRFKITGALIKPVAPGIGGCIATDQILVDGKKVGYMYREESSFKGDSGWRFFSGEESPAYISDAKRSGVYDVNTVANYDPAIVPYLSSPPGTAFGRISGTDEFEKEDLNLDQD